MRCWALVWCQAACDSLNQLHMAASHCWHHDPLPASNLQPATSTAAAVPAAAGSSQPVAPTDDDDLLGFALVADPSLEPLRGLGGSGLVVWQGRLAVPQPAAPGERHQVRALPHLQAVGHVEPHPLAVSLDEPAHHAAGVVPPDLAKRLACSRWRGSVGVGGGVLPWWLIPGGRASVRTTTT